MLKMNRFAAFAALLLLPLCAAHAQQTDIRPKGTTTVTGTVAISQTTPGTTNGVAVKQIGSTTASTGQFTNTNAAIRYLQIYNKATAGTLSTDTPALTIPLPPNVPVPVNFTDIGGAFATGISWQFTTDDVAIPTTAGASTDIHGFVTYK